MVLQMSLLRLGVRYLFCSVTEETDWATSASIYAEWNQYISRRELDVTPITGRRKQKHAGMPISGMKRRNLVNDSLHPDIVIRLTPDYTVYRPVGVAQKGKD